jgi:hypothetical protein
MTGVRRIDEPLFGLWALTPCGSWAAVTWSMDGILPANVPLITGYAVRFQESMDCILISLVFFYNSIYVFTYIFCA